MLFLVILGQSKILREQGGSLEITSTVPLIVGEDDVSGYLMKEGFSNSLGFIARLRDKTNLFNIYYIFR